MRLTGAQVHGPHPLHGDIDLRDLGAHPEVDVAGPVLLRRACDELFRSVMSPPTQYGMPQAEYEVKGDRAKATISSSSGPLSLRAWDAADMPAA